MARAMVLAAGLGTRLRPLTEELPKPLVPVGDRPLVGHIAERLRAAGFPELVMNTHHGAEYFASRIHELGLAVHLVHEPVIRGTAGGIAGARSLLTGGPVIVWNGDILAEPSLPELLDRAGSGLAFAIVPRAAGEGTVGMGDRGQVVRLRDERFGSEASGGDYIGVAALGPAALSTLPERGCLVADVALPALRRGESIAAVPVRGGFTDVGSVRAYHQANLDWLGRTRGPGKAWVHPTAQVAGPVELRECVIGEGARVFGEGLLDKVVVWPGAAATAPLRDAVVTTRGSVVRIP